MARNITALQIWTSKSSKVCQRLEIAGWSAHSSNILNLHLMWSIFHATSNCYQLSEPPSVEGVQSYAAFAEKNTSPVKRECNDFFLLVPFVTIVITMVVFAAKYGGDFISATNIDGLLESSGVNLMLRIVGLSAFASAGMSFVWMAVIMLLAEVVIWVALITAVFLNIAIAFIFTKKAYNSDFYWYLWPSVVFGLLALLISCYACFIHKRIKFAAAHLQVAGHAIFHLPMMLFVALVMVCIQIGWAVLWVLGSLGILFHRNGLKLERTCMATKCELIFNSTATLGVLCVILFIYFWITCVFRNIIGVTTAGTIAAWMNPINTSCITMKAWLRALTQNLGSICLGSLSVAVLETIVVILRVVAWLAGHSGNCCLSCLLSCVSSIVSSIESWIEVFNQFAYSYVGCYGYSFMTASRRAYQLFKSKGWSAIVNDELMGCMFWLSNFIIGFVTACIGVQTIGSIYSIRVAIYAYPHGFVAFFCFLVGFSINYVLMAVVASAVTTIFVLWAEDPHIWQLTRPKHYETLHEAWLQNYPDEYNYGYGKQGSISICDCTPCPI